MNNDENFGNFAQNSVLSILLHTKSTWFSTHKTWQIAPQGQFARVTRRILSTTSSMVLIPLLLNPWGGYVAAGFTIATGTGELRNTEEHNCHGGQG